MKLGSILPTRESLRISDECAATQDKLDKAFAANDKVLSRCARFVYHGTLCYRLNARQYAEVHNQRAYWFEQRQDGDYAIAKPEQL